MLSSSGRCTKFLALTTYTCITIDSFPTVFVPAVRKITHTRGINEKQDAYLILHIYFLRGTLALYISKRDKTGLREKM